MSRKRERRGAAEAARREVNPVGGDRRVGRGQRKEEHEEGWNQVFLNAGHGDDRRFSNLGEALACKRRVMRMTPDRPKGRKEGGGRRPCGITAERIVHSQGKLFEKFLVSLGAEGWSESEKLLLMDSRKSGGLEAFASWKQGRVDGWVSVGVWRVFRGSFKDAETGEEFSHEGRYIFKKNERGEWITVQWEMELSDEDRRNFLPKSHPLHPDRLKKSVKGGRVGGTNLLIRAVETPEVDLSAFAASLWRK